MAGRPTLRATGLSRSIWNGIADLARRSQSPREIYFSEVTKTDEVRRLVWAKDFGDVAIPLVAFASWFAYYDTQADGSVQRRDDPTHVNENFRTHVVMPRRGDVVVVLDPWGAKRFPIVVGTFLSVAGAWEES